MEHPVKKMKTGIVVSVVFVVFFIVFFNNVIYNEPRGHYPEAITDLGTVEGWEFNTSRDVGNYILGDNTTILMPDHFCDSSKFLIVIVCSAPGNLLHRITIRETWASSIYAPADSVNVYFLIGETSNLTLQEDIIEEHKKYKDIIQDHFIDTYNNLTLKSVVLLKLIQMHCMHSLSYVMKCDDDSFINIPVLTNKLRNNQTWTKQFLAGALICGAKPIKDPTNKWYTPGYMFNGKVYPNYLSGSAYLMSIDVASMLYEAALKTPIFHIEDIYVTGMLSKYVKVRPRSFAGFQYEGLRKFDPCAFKSIIAFHHTTPTQMKSYFVKLQKYTPADIEKACKIQERARNKTFSLFKYFDKLSNKKTKKKRIECY